MVITPDNLQTLNTGFSAAFQGAFTTATPAAEVLATVAPSNTASNTYGWMAKLQRMQEWIGARKAQNLSAHSYILTNKKFEMTVEVGVDEIEDDQYGVYTPRFQEMGGQARMVWHDLIVKALKAGETTLCFDGQMFFDTDHPVYPGDDSQTASYSNLFTGTPLTATNYEAKRAVMEGYIGEDGEPLGIVVTHLICGPKLRSTAKRILKAQNDAAGASNVNYEDAELLVLPEITGEEWFLACLNRPIKPFVLQKRKEPTLVPRIDPSDPKVFEQDVFTWGAKARGAVGYTLPFLIIKCKP